MDNAESAVFGIAFLDEDVTFDPVAVYVILFREVERDFGFYVRRFTAVENCLDRAEETEREVSVVSVNVAVFVEIGVLFVVQDVGQTREVVKRIRRERG